MKLMIPTLSATARVVFPSYWRAKTKEFLLMTAALCRLGMSAMAAVDANTAGLESPDGRIAIKVAVRDDDGQKGRVFYSVSYSGKPVLLESRLGLELKEGPPLAGGFEITALSRASHDEQWKPVYGERSSYRDNYSELVVDLREQAPPHRTIQLAFRAFNEGAAFRYTVPKQPGMDRISISRENSEFRFSDDPAAWAVYSAQGNYEKITLKAVKPGCERPLVLQLASDCYVALGEAGLVDYARMKLAPLKEASNALVSDLAGGVEASLPLTTPWRFIMAAESPGRLLENNFMVLNLNEPCAIPDTSWIKPGKVIREVTLTTTGGRACVDFAVKHGLQYIEFDAGWYGREDDDKSDASGVNVDPKRSKGPLDLHEVIRYARDRGVGVILYVNRRALEKQLDQILPLYKKWGVAGVKYGFVNVGSQQWTSWLHEAVRKAAAHQLMVDVHDEYRPTGYSRTYPNLMTQEGIAGDETSPANANTLTILFSRFLAGAADNTICYYDKRVNANATHAYQLAKAVCLYSPWQFLYWYDRPSAAPEKIGGAGNAETRVGNEPELEFYDLVPTVWDDTRVIHGRIGEFAVIARRSGDTWFIGGMNSGEARTLDVPLNFLERGKKYTAAIYSDDASVSTRTHVRVTRQSVDANAVLKMPLSAQGGQAVRIAPDWHSDSSRNCQTDWLIDPAPYKAGINEDTSKRELALDNGLVRRVIRLSPNAATIDYRNLVTGEQLLRVAGPEALVTINGKDYAIGGLEGQPVKNYLKAKWIEDLRANPAAYRFAGWKQGPIEPRLAWKKHPEWLSRDYPWPAPGRQVSLRFIPPEAAPQPDLPEIEVHYALYDGIPLIEKWLVIRNTSSKTARIDRTVVETLRVQENESATEPNINWELPSLYVETDYAYLSMNAKSANMRSVRWLPDPGYETQVSYIKETPCLLECAPEFGPDTDIAPGESLTSIRCFELFRDGTDRERRGLAQRRLYRTIAPWTQENPVMVHLISDKPEAIRKIVDQGAEAGVELIILSFGSGMNMENRDPAYQAKYKEVADYARSKGIVIGSYSLLASRGGGTTNDNCGGPGSRIRYGSMPCLGSQWGRDYLAQLQSFLTNTGFGILEHDGSYPGDTCSLTSHPGHRGLGDSQWRQFTEIANFYKWCRANGIHLNVPDWYYLNGSTKCAMNYKEENWSLPRDEQEIIERQNVFDGTWEKTASMGWMFVPLTQYHGGGGAATIEPLSEHLDHYEARLSDLFGAGVQACYRGPRIYDTDATRDVVKKWISFYKRHRQVLDADIVHLRRPDGRDWDGILHVNPIGKEKGLAFFYNPLPEKIQREIRLPLYYTGLTGEAKVSEQDGQAVTYKLARDYSIAIPVVIPANGRTWFVIE